MRLSGLTVGQLATFAAMSALGAIVGQMAVNYARKKGFDI